MSDRLTTYLIAVLAALAAGIAVWLAANLLGGRFERWRRRFQDEADFELEEMLYQMPGRVFINYSLGAALVAALLVFLLVGSLGGGPWNWKAAFIFAAMTLVAAVFAARFVLRALRNHRLEKFNDQLEESLMGMSNALKAGFSIIQAIEMVIKQKRQPISVEFSLMLQQTKLGMSFEDALKNMSQRVSSEDFDLVASAIRTARMTGGDLTGVFDRLSALIRERRRIQRRIRTLTAQGRLQGIVLGLLPILLLLVLFFMDPDLIRNFFSQPIGILLFLVVLFLECCGFFVIRKIIDIDI